MKQEKLTAVAVRDGSLEWTSMVRGKVSGAVSGRGTVAFDRQVSSAEGTVDADNDAAKAIAGLEGDIVLSLPTQDLLTQIVKLPRVEESELINIARLQIDKISPFPTENVVTGCEVLKEKSDSMTVLVCAVREEIVNSLRDRLFPQSIYPSRVDANIMGRLHLFAGKKRQLFILLEGSALEIVIAEDGVPLVIRSLPGMEGLADNEFREETLLGVNQAVMAMELQHGPGELSGITLIRSRPFPQEGALSGRLSEEYGCKTNVASPDESGTLSERLVKRAFETKGRLDLSPLGWKTSARKMVFRRKLLKAVSIIMGCWLLGIILMTGLFVIQKSRVSLLRDELSELDKSTAEVRAVVSRVKMIEDYVGRELSALECMAEVTEAQPQGVILTSFMYRKNDSVAIAGESDTVDNVYSFKKKLDESSLFTEARLRGPTLETRRQMQIFDIDLKLRGSDI